MHYKCFFLCVFERDLWKTKGGGPPQSRLLDRWSLPPIVRGWLDYLPCIASPHSLPLLQQQSHQYTGVPTMIVFTWLIWGYWKCCSISDTDQVLILRRYQVHVDRWLTVEPLSRILSLSISGIQSSTHKKIKKKNFTCQYCRICSLSGISCSHFFFQMFMSEYRCALCK